MLKEEDIHRSVGAILEDSGLFLVDLTVTKDNHIRILIDKQEGINIEDCARISRLLDARLNRDEEDFELEVSSPGLDSPLRVLQQYLRNIGNEVEIVKKDGIKINGRLIQVDDDGITLEIEEKATKRKKGDNVNFSAYFHFSDIKSTKVKINF
ncbi:MAG: hypothetical protein AMS27_15835 [Bacteroides sp. SM23_62_1]|nr:MAG: hypothetical protein AMS27_15835 [Bacteroides sp. SM23_62_1]